jgi:hypothetical protein
MAGAVFGIKVSETRCIFETSIPKEVSNGPLGIIKR